jgi:hypothetical protein
MFLLLKLRGETIHRIFNEPRYFPLVWFSIHLIRISVRNVPVVRMTFLANEITFYKLSLFILQS